MKKKTFEFQGETLTRVDLRLVSRRRIDEVMIETRSGLQQQGLLLSQAELDVIADQPGGVRERTDFRGTRLGKETTRRTTMERYDEERTGHMSNAAMFADRDAEIAARRAEAEAAGVTPDTLVHANFINDTDANRGWLIAIGHLPLSADFRGSLAGLADIQEPTAVTGGK
jgi:hypothetical protein